jgi:hypothetical protein
VSIVFVLGHVHCPCMLKLSSRPRVDSAKRNHQSRRLKLEINSPKSESSKSKIAVVEKPTREFVIVKRSVELVSTSKTNHQIENWRG